MADAVSVHQEGESPPLHPRGVSYAKPIDAAKEAVTVMELAERLVGGPLFRNGQRFKARCPLPDHHENTPSFTVYVDNERGWYCYGCGRGGDVVPLAALAWSYQDDMATAAAMLLMEFGHEVPQRPPSWYARQERQRNMRNAIHRERVEHIRLLVYRLIWMPWLRTLPEWMLNEAERSAWDRSLWMAERLYAERRSA